ncbi:MAG: sugar ABC transporter substrate-binding protein, partial [Thermoflexales bacterium]
ASLVLSACAAAPAAPTAAPASPASTKPASAEPVNLRVTVWSGNEKHLQTMNDIAGAYKVKNPNVSVKFDVIPFADYLSKLTVQMSGNNPPDLGWVVENSAPALIDAGVLVDLKPTLDKTQNYNFAEYSQPAMGLWQRGNTVYGIPFSTSPFFIVYNKDLFAKAGMDTPDKLLAQGKWNWETLAQASKAIAATGGGVYGFQPIDSFPYNANIIAPVIRAYGGDLWDATGTKCALNADSSVKAMQLIHDMLFKDKSAMPIGDKSDFYAGQVGMTTAQLSRLAKLDKAPFKWDVIPMPSGPAGDSQIVGQAALGVFRSGKNQPAALDFAAFMTNAENTAKMSIYFPPARKSVLESTAFLTSNPMVSPDQMKAAVTVGIEKGKIVPVHANFAKIELALKPIFDKVWLPGADVKAQMDEACKAIAPLLTP